MPSKYTVRSFVKDSYYHVYNRGNDQRLIFLDDEDYNMFYYYLFVYLAPLEKSARRYKEVPLRLAHKNLSGDVTLISYCLMPNHYHFLLHQQSLDGISRLMKQLTNAYTQYFNDKYKRTGPLFSGRYKAVHVTKDDYLTHLTRYIHLNPVVAGLTSTPDYHWSSYSEFTDPSPRNLTHPKDILTRFPSIYMYKRFVLDQKDYAKKLDRLKHLTIEE